MNILTESYTNNESPGNGETQITNINIFKSKMLTECTHGVGWIRLNLFFFSQMRLRVHVILFSLRWMVGSEISFD